MLGFGVTGGCLQFGRVGRRSFRPGTRSWVTFPPPRPVARQRGPAEVTALGWPWRSLPHGCTCGPCSDSSFVTGGGEGRGRGVQLRNGKIKFPRCSGPRSSCAVWRGNGDSENPASYFFPYHLAFPLPLSAAGTVNYGAAEPSHLGDTVGGRRWGEALSSRALPVARGGSQKAFGGAYGPPSAPRHRAGSPAPPQAPILALLAQNLRASPGCRPRRAVAVPWAGWQGDPAPGRGRGDVESGAGEGRGDAGAELPSFLPCRGSAAGAEPWCCLGCASAGGLPPLLLFAAALTPDEGCEFLTRR